jgi:predicted AAA+ superfamily ATPase
MIKRTAETKLKSLANFFPAVGVIGPRQSGKTTLVKKLFPQKPYVLLEDPDTRQSAIKDPRDFLSRFPDGAVLDEVQRAPELFSYLQGILDEKDKPGFFILTGSQNFLLMESITQSLAGRVALLSLLPLSLEELQDSGISFPSFEDYLIRGFYPRIYDKKVLPKDLYANYVRTYLERDVRLLKNIHDLTAFHTFLKLCAHRTGQLLNLSSLAMDCGITHNTAKAWLSLLETSYIVFFLRPHHKNFNKRLVKMPKMYFYDMGLAAYLAGIEDRQHLLHHPLRGAMFESFVVSDLLKARFNKGGEPDLYFWRDKNGHEIDCLVERSGGPVLIEIKSGRTVTEDFFNNLRYYQKLSGTGSADSYVIYGGDQEQKRSCAQVIPWNKLSAFAKITE